jgi:hypothetical protein
LELPPETSDGIFLAGPTMRDVDELAGWRKEAFEIFEEKFKCDLYIPEFRDGKASDWTYDRQVLWEISLLAHARVIMFWIPRSTELPAFTTNIEFGEWVNSGKVVIGCPDDAEKMDYIRTRCKFSGIPVHKTLKETVEAAMAMFQARRLLEKYGT